MTIDEFNKANFNGEKPFVESVLRKFKKGSNLCSVGEIGVTY